MSSPHLLDVRDLVVRFHTGDGVVHAVNDVSFHVDVGETLAIVGESGSGKSITVLSLLRLVREPPGRIESGEVWFEGRDLLTLDRDALRAVRGGRIAMIFQDPLSSLNPVFTIGTQIVEALRAQDPTVSRSTARRRAIDLLGAVNIANPRAIVDDYPHRLSGGMCQRVMLAIAISGRPRLLIADEPTTALDSTTQAQLLELVRQLQRDLGMAMIWISHDLGVVAGLADRVQVMYAGRVVETAAVDRFYAHPLHPYSQALMRCVPRLDVPRQARLRPIEGTAPDMTRPAAGCAFAPRCALRLDRCVEERPALDAAGPGRARACWASESRVRAAEQPTTADA